MDPCLIRTSCPPLFARLQSYKTLDENLLQCTVTCSCTKFSLNFYVISKVIHTGLPTKNETAKTTENSLNIIILKINEVLCLEKNYLIAYLMILQKVKQVYRCRESY